MSALLALLDPPRIMAGLVVLSLNAYVLMGGADYGGGVWDLLASGPRRAEQRALIASAIGPIWEANHVWLIISVVIVFTAFPAAFATLGIVLHVPLAALLVGIVLRGSAFVFRSYGPPSGMHGTTAGWGRVFAVASTITPVLLGTVIGALATGAVGRASTHANGESFGAVYIAPWLAAFPIAIGVLTLALFSLLAAVYLTLEAPDDALREDFRRRGLFAAGAVFVIAFGALYVARRQVPRIEVSSLGMSWTLPLHICTGAAALAAIWGLWSRRYSAARVAVIVQVSCILWGWALSQYPWIVPDALTIEASAAPRFTIDLLLAALALGGLALIPSLVYLFRTFSAKVER